MTKRHASLLAVLALVAGAAVFAASQTGEEGRVQAAVSKRFPTLKITDVRATPIAGIYQFVVGVDVYYTDASGRFVLRGDLIDFADNRNISEERRAELRVGLLASVPDAQTIVFGSDDAKVTLNVFTDVDCGYCRRLHQDMPQLNAQGVRVRYLFYPRAGLGSESWQKAVDVWCAKDRRKALTEAKAGRPVPRGECADAPVAAHYRLGEMMGVDGTPMVYTPDGRLIGGYLPVPALLREIEGKPRTPRG